MNLDMTQKSLSLKQISESVFKYMLKLSTQRVFGTIKIELREGKPNRVSFEESFVAKDIV